MRDNGDRERPTIDFVQLADEGVRVKEDLSCWTEKKAKVGVAETEGEKFPSPPGIKPRTAHYPKPPPQQKRPLIVYFKRAKNIYESKV